MFEILLLVAILWAIMYGLIALVVATITQHLAWGIPLVACLTFGLGALHYYWNK
jgi:hypothetical protein